MDNSKLTKIQLLEKCKELGIIKCSSKNKKHLIELIKSKHKTNNNTTEKYENNLISENVIIEPSTSLLEPITETLNVIDLFCGCGGMSKGLTDAGLNIIAGIDIWDKAIQSYNKNFEHKAYCEDLTASYVL